MIGQEVLDGRPVIQENSHAFKNTMIKLLHEYINNEFVSTCWITNVMDVSDATSTTLR